MKIGISIFAKENDSVWASGITQNILFLAMALKEIHQVEDIFLINGGSGNSLPSGWPEKYKFNLVSPEDVTYDIDLVIIMGARLPEAWVLRVQSLGKKVIFFDVGHSYSGLIESAIYSLPERGIYTSPMDETWIISCHYSTCHSQLEIMTGKPIMIAPHIWSPIILENSIKNLEESYIFGFNERQKIKNRSWRIAIFEPNISIIKNSYLPMLIADGAYRINPNAIELMAAFNTFHLKEHLTFNRLASHLDLTKSGKATYEGRVAFAEAVGSFKIDAIISHQIENDQNYLYYDALYGGYPLIHNSLYLKEFDAGFYYPEFQAKKGVRSLLKAFENRGNESFWSEYENRSKKLLAQVHPNSKNNIEKLSMLLEKNRPETIYHV